MEFLALLLFFGKFLGCLVVWTSAKSLGNLTRKRRVKATTLDLTAYRIPPQEGERHV